MTYKIQHIPLGNSLPINNPHSVSVSLPSLQNVIDYEENKPELLNQLNSGYPRFFKNKLVQKLEEYVKNLHQIDDEKVLFPITSPQAKTIIEYIFNEQFEYITLENVCFLVLPKNHEKLIPVKKIIQNIGAIISSRNAEKILFDKGIIHQLFQEERLEIENPQSEIIQILSEAYSAKKENIFLTNSGTNAVFSAIETLTKIKKNEGKTLNVQLGWLYLDSIDIIKKRSDENFLFVNIHQKEQFENWLAENHQKVANIISETVSNPILQCLDLPWLSSLCKKYEIGLILDHTMASPFCAEALPYCDIAVESLTKFACGNANILMGAVMVNENSPYQDQIKSEIEKYTLKPYLLDCQRLAFEMQEYEVRMQKISKNVSQVYDYLKTQDFVEKIYSVYEENSWQNFQKIRKNNNHIGLITVIFKKPLAQCYDALNFSKGPSLGTEFTLAMPYTYLAHYDLLQTEEGKKFLEEAGLDARIIRISVGTEPIEDIINEFEKIKRL